MKTCQRCGKEYQPTGTYQKFCADCRDVAGKEAVAQYAQIHKKELSAYSLKWYYAHHRCHDQWIAAHRDKVRATKAAYEKRHPEKRQLITIKHRALKRGNTPVDEVLTFSQWQQVLDSYGHRCAYCGVKSDHLTVDHVIPVARGGQDTMANVVPACQHCNCSKGAKTPEERFGMGVCSG